MYHLISALTGKVDKDKQKRDLEIIKSAREDNILNFSLMQKSSADVSRNQDPRYRILMSHYFFVQVINHWIIFNLLKFLI